MLEVLKHLTMAIVFFHLKLRLSVPVLIVRPTPKSNSSRTVAALYSGSSVDMTGDKPSLSTKGATW